MDILPPLAQALAERGYAELTSVQKAVLEADCAGRDLLVSAQTGSGKTVAFGLAMAFDVLGDAEHFCRAAEPLALIVAPTRELALQVTRELSWLYGKARGRVVSCVGGMDPRAESRQLAAGAHIVVGTPGRLRDHLERGALATGALQTVVLDEADEMLDLGFAEDLEFILQATPAERRTLLFSATLPPDIVRMASQYQKNSVRVAVSSGQRGHADIEYRAVRIAPNEVEHAVVNILRYFESPNAMVFCNTRESVRHLQAILLERGFAAVALSGELSQNERNHALQALRDGRARVCVATDVAARGIDLPNLGLVIHADLPTNAETLQHRSGRTGRAGRKGTSVLLASLSRSRRAESLLRAAGIQPVWSGAPSPDEIQELDRTRLLDHPMFAAEAGEGESQAVEALMERYTPEQLAAALVRLHQSGLPAAEEVFDPGPMRSSAPVRDPMPDRPRTAGRSAPSIGDSSWFRLNLGRQKNADPRWLIPMICRQGKITKAEIGQIRILDRETRFEIAAAAAERFTAAVAETKRGDLRIEPAQDGGMADSPPPRRKDAVRKTLVKEMKRDRPKPPRK